MNTKLTNDLNIFGIKKSSPAAWIMAIRLKTLPVGAAPVIVGCASVYGQEFTFNYFAAVAAFLGAVFLQIGSNLANDVFDFEKGADSKNRLGPPRAAQTGLLTPVELKTAMIVAFLFASAAGAYLVFTAGYIIAIIGVLSILCAITYTGGPFALGYKGLGDLFVFIFFGPVAVCGTALAVSGFVPVSSFMVSVSMGALATNVLIVNNLRDRHADKQSGKKTLIVRFGKTFGIIFYAVNMLAGFAVPVLLWFFNKNSDWMLLPVAALLVAIPVFGSLAKKTMSKNDDGPGFNRVLAQTAMLTLLFGLLLTAGFIL